MINKNKNKSFFVIPASPFVIPAKAGIYKKILSYLFLIIVSLFIFGDIGFADGAATASNPVVVNTASELVKSFNAILSIIGALLGVLTAMVGWFLSPGWVNGELFGMTKYLKELWILVSNVVYFIFAGIIIVIAFMNIIGKGGEKFELKQALPKFIVGILIVPASWFIVQFILSISAVLTVSVLSLPFDTFPSIETKLSGVKMCNNRVFDTQVDGYKEGVAEAKKLGDSDAEKIYQDLVNKTNFYCVDKNGTYLPKGSEDSNLQEVILGKGDGLYSIIAIYTYGILDINKIQTLSKEDLGVVTNIVDLIIKVGVDVIFVFMYLILLVALFLALFIRGIYLWLYALFSPVFGLTYFLGDKGGETLKKFTIKEFISLAMVPVYVSAALSFGLLFLLVAGTGTETTTSDTTSSANSPFIDGKVKMGGMTIDVLGLKGKDNKNSLSGVLFNGLGGALGAMIVQVFGLALLWIAVMAALNASKVTGEIVKPIAEFGTKVGNLAMSAPKYIPIPGTGGLSAHGLDSAMGTISGEIQSRAGKAGSEWAQQKFPGLFEGQKEFLQKLNTLQSASVADIKGLYEKGRDALSSVNDPYMRANLINAYADKLKEAGKNVTGIDDKLIEEFRLSVGNKDKFEETLKQMHNESYNKSPTNSLLGGNLISGNNDEVTTRLKSGGGTTNNNQKVENLVNVYVNPNGDAVAKGTSGGTQIIDESSNLLVGSEDLFIKYLNKHKKGIFTEDQIKSTYGDQFLIKLKKSDYFKKNEDEK